MYCLDYAERPQPFIQLSSMLHQMVRVSLAARFVSVLSVPYSYSCKILPPYIAATVRMHSDAVFSSIGASQMKTLIKKVNAC